MATKFEDLSESQQIEVLKYLEATNTDDLQEASRLVAAFGFNSAQAVRHRFDNHRPTGHETHNNNSSNNSRQRAHNLNQEQEREVAEYIRHVQKVLQERTVWNLFWGCSTYAIKSLCRSLSSTLLPSSLNQAIFYSSFDKLYKNISRTALQSTNFEEALQKGKRNQKVVAVIVSPANRQHPRVTETLNSPNLSKLLNMRFVCFGMTVGSVTTHGLPDPQRPAIVFCFNTIYDKPSVLRTVYLEQTLLQQSVFTEVIQQYRGERRREKNILIRYHNLIVAHNTATTDEAADLMEEEIPEDTNRLIEERRIREEQHREYQEAMRLSKEAEENRRREQEQLQKEKIRMESIKEERQARKMSIPDEPHEGEMVCLVFRCPDGRKVTRKFGSDEKVELIFDWVQTNEEIEFQEEKREFHLLRSYPPVPIEEGQKQKCIREVFSDPQEIIVIKEL